MVAIFETSTHALINFSHCSMRENCSDACDSIMSRQRRNLACFLSIAKVFFFLTTHLRIFVGRPMRRSGKLSTCPLCGRPYRPIDEIFVICLGAIQRDRRAISTKQCLQSMMNSEQPLGLFLRSVILIYSPKLYV